MLVGLGSRRVRVRILVILFFCLVNYFFFYIIGVGMNVLFVGFRGIRNKRFRYIFRV